MSEAIHPRQIVKAWFGRTESLTSWDDEVALDDLCAALEAAWQREADADEACAAALTAVAEAAKKFDLWDEVLPEYGSAHISCRMSLKDLRDLRCALADLERNHSAVSRAQRDTHGSVAGHIALVKDAIRAINAPASERSEAAK